MVLVIFLTVRVQTQRSGAVSLVIWFGVVRRYNPSFPFYGQWLLFAIAVLASTVISIPALSTCSSFLDNFSNSNDL